MPRSLSASFLRLLCLSLVLALFLPGLSLWFPEFKVAAFFRPQSSPPDTGLPDLDLQKAINPPAPQAPAPIPSTAASWSPYDAYPYLAGSYTWQIFNSLTGAGTSQTWGISGDRPVPADYDGDGRTDVAVWRPSDGSWQIIKSSNGAVMAPNWGVNGDVPVPADYDGDGKADIAVWRPSAGTWYIIKSSNGSTLTQGWGISGDIPVPAKYDNDSKADIAVWRPSTGSWYIINSGNGSTTTILWGTSGDKAVPADYDGDGRADIAVWRPSAGTWYIIKSSGGTTTQGWGVGSDKPVPADYDGDGRADVAVWRPSDGSWQIIKSSNGAVMAPSWGINGDLLAPAKYDGDGKADLAVCRASLPADNFANARLDTANRTGQAGEDLFSGNFNWSLPLVGLAGRAGLDLGLSLTYNSLVWTRDDGVIKFNADNGYPSPGFRLGLPQIQGPFTSAQTGTPSYLMIMPSGYRVELRKVGSTNLYETADSSYMQFDSSSLVARTSDGTQLTFTLNNQEYRCTEVKDRNGNFITANYDGVTGHLTSIIDTLGRTLSFVYDGFGHLQRITQPWNGVTHNWATFGYANKTLQTNFSGLTAVGPNNGSQQPMLTQVGLADGSRYEFSYNSYLQVNLITHKAADDHELSHLSYDLPPAGVTQLADCPRFTKRADMVERWNGGGEVETTFSFVSPTQNYGQVSLPDLTKYRETFGTFDYLKGLTLQTDVLLGDVSKKKTTITTWTQDDPALSYILNPRPTRIDINDDQGNSRHSAISYQTFDLLIGVKCALPSDTTEYAANGTTVLRQTHTTYRTDSTYINSSRRLIGLPDTEFLYEGAGTTLLSKVDYQYDLADDATNQYLVATSSVAVNHDTAYNDTNFRQGRGNLSIRRRYDVSTSSTANNPSLAAKFSTGYDTAGNLIFSRDPADHKMTYSYADLFVQTGTPSTVAYPTKITDPDGFFSTVRYDYDLGAVQETADPKGAKQMTTYDAAGRVSRIEINNGPNDGYPNGAYTRYVYDTTLTRVNRFSLVQTGLAENFVFQQLDGIGRVTETAGIFPNSTGGYRGQAMFYDTMGRMTNQSNPTEMTNIWGATGDDASWVYTMQTYDWKGRPRITTNPDQTTRQYDYTGCGCAGGEQVTFTDESNRKQRTTYDVLGRVAKTEVFKADATTIYATTGYTYNGRDQATLVRQYDGTDGSTTFQDTVMTYDGHGRLQTRHRPIEIALDGTTLAKTTFDYNADDTLHIKTDPRNVTFTYTYNARHLVTNIIYTKPAGSAPEDSNSPAVIPAVPPVDFTYDAAGNRQSVTYGHNNPGEGRCDYVYDTFSRLKSETHQFKNLLDPNSGAPANWVLTYDYNLAGQLKSLTDAFNQQVAYDYTAAGELTGASFAGASFVSGLRYRAWGALKRMDMNNGLYETADYNARQQLTQYALRKASDNSALSGYEYRYDLDTTSIPNQPAPNDGRVRYARDLTTASSSMDRAYSYDQMGRLTSGRSGNEARGESNNVSGPYNHTYGYDAFGNMNGRHGRNGYYGPGSVPLNYVVNYVNDRNQGSGSIPAWEYNAAGNVTDADGQQFHWNAAGQMSQAVNLNQDLSYDGDDQNILRVVTDASSNPPTITTTYYVRSSVLGGQVINEVEMTDVGGVINNVRRSYIYANGRKVGRKKNGNKFWVSEDPAVLTYVETDEVQAVNSRVQMDPLGVVTATGPGPGGTPPPGSTSNPQGYYGNPANAGAGCRLDGAPFPCDWLARIVNGGGAVYCPNNDCGPRQALDKQGTPISGVYEWFNPTPGDNWHSTAVGHTLTGIRVEGKLLGQWEESFRPAGADFLDASGDLIAGEYGPPYIRFLTNDGTTYDPKAWNPQISKILYGFLSNNECLNAYRLAGIELTRLLNNGVDIGPVDLLQNAKPESIGLKPATQLGMAKTFFNAGGAFTSTPQAISTVGAAGTTNGLPKVFLGQQALAAGIFSSSTDTLKEVLAHELLHSGGYRPGSKGANDLAYMEKAYDNVIDTCAK